MDDDADGARRRLAECSVEQAGIVLVVALKLLRRAAGEAAEAGEEDAALRLFAAWRGLAAVKVAAGRALAGPVVDVSVPDTVPDSWSGE